MTTQFEIAWNGSFDGAWWREHSETRPADEVSASLIASVRAYLSARPGQWVSASTIVASLQAESMGVSDRLRRLVESGELERRMIRRRRKDGYRRRDAVYRWVELAQ